MNGGQETDVQERRLICHFGNEFKVDTDSTAC